MTDRPITDAELEKLRIALVHNPRYLGHSNPGFHIRRLIARHDAQAERISELSVISDGIVSALEAHRYIVHDPAQSVVDVVRAVLRDSAAKDARISELERLLPIETVEELLHAEERIRELEAEVARLRNAAGVALECIDSGNLNDAAAELESVVAEEGGERG